MSRPLPPRAGQPTPSEGHAPSPNDPNAGSHRSGVLLSRALRLFGGFAGKLIVKAAPPPPGTAGSRTRSPPIARHSSRETYSPSPLPPSAVGVARPARTGVNSRSRSVSATPGPPSAIVSRSGRPRRRQRRSRVIGVRAAVLDRVVEQRPEHLVELVGVGDGQPAAGPVVEVEGDVVDAERLPRLADPGRQRHDLASWLAARPTRAGSPSAAGGPSATAAPTARR